VSASTLASASPAKLPKDALTSVACGKMDSVIYARLEPHADLYRELKRLCKEHDIRTGVVMTVTGALEKARLQLMDTSLAKTGTPKVVELTGPFEASGHGIVGRFREGDSGGIFNGEEAGSAYLHVHLTVTLGFGEDAKTYCGHLMEGCTVRSNHPVSHFTIVLGKVAGVQLDLAVDREAAMPGYADGLRYHALAEIPVLK
jgi:predicted DNA-binding protein with PD1-like motif